MDISCAFPANSDAVKAAVLAEELGYRRVWIYDSPALYHDVWVTLARIAERTERIGLGPGVLVPHLRHPMTQAAAIATLAELAPGRLAVALGAGFTGRLAMGQPMLSRREFERSVRQVQALLRGEVVEIDGAATQMLHSVGYAPDRPIDVPFLVNAQGPRGQAFAREIKSGVTVSFSPVAGFDWCAVLSTGTVLDPGESPTSERAFEATAPSLAVRYHGLAARGQSLDALLGRRGVDGLDRGRPGGGATPRDPPRAPGRAERARPQGAQSRNSPTRAADGNGRAGTGAARESGRQGARPS